MPVVFREGHGLRLFKKIALVCCSLIYLISLFSFLFLIQNYELLIKLQHIRYSFLKHLSQISLQIFSSFLRY
jgi:hypothetical protein